MSSENPKYIGSKGNDFKADSRNILHREPTLGFHDIDVTEAKDEKILNVALNTVAASYRIFTSSRRTSPLLSQEEVFKLLCEDKYAKGATTLVAHAKDPQTGKQEFIGTMRLSMIRDGEEFPLEAMRLMDAPYWPPGIKGEIGRLAFRNDFDWVRSNLDPIQSALTIHAFEKAKTLRPDGDQICAIMPGFILRGYKATGFEPIEIEGTSLREYDPHAREIYDKFPGYWRKSNSNLLPKLYTFQLK